FLCVLVPAVLGCFYFTAIASDRFAAGAGFSVRSMDASPVGGDILGALSGLSSVGTTTTDSYIIVKYLESEELVKQLIKEADFLNAYSSDQVDFLYRLDTSKPIEDIVEYWDWMIDVSYDTSSEIIEFEVQAFSAIEAEKIALLITRYAQELINRLSSEARNDAVRFAKREVAAAELRLKFAREQLREFRTNNRSLDPTAIAAALAQLTTELESQIIEQRARLNVLRQNLSESSSSIKEVKIQISSLEKELASKRSEISKSSEDKDLASLLSGFERLQVEQEFAQQAYTVALSSLERARAEADRQQRFLAVFKQPSQPSSAIYPTRILNSILILFIALILWSIGLFIFYSVRDHLR
ncbi:MAG: lipopolysaccharide biosynthesis protein, partial [Lentilitoribacter sp.]